MNDIELRKFDRESLQTLVQIMEMMKMEVLHSPSIYYANDPSPLYVHVHGDEGLQMRILPGKKSKAGKDGMLIKVFGMGQAAAVTVPHPANPADYVPSIIKSTCGLMARAYAKKIRRKELEQEIDNAE